MNRESAIEQAIAFMNDGSFVAELSRRVAVRTESQKPEQAPELRRYLEEEIAQAFEAMGHDCHIYDNPESGKGPVLLATRIEDPDLPTVLGYGHGDVIRGLEDQWRAGLSPWVTVQEGDRLYGRGTADNKGQHCINMNAMRIAMDNRGRLGFNSKFMVETGEENGSPGLHQLVSDNREAFAADVFIASDGPRVSPDLPTIVLGARGARNFDLVCDLREGGHHSGNWGGLLANPGIILAHALASIVSETGRIRIKEWLPGPLPNSVRAALRALTIDVGSDGPEIDENWGEPGLSPAEQVYGFNSFEVLAYETGNPERPVNAVPPRARAHCQLRFVADTDRDAILPALRAHLDRQGFGMVAIEPPPAMNAGDFASTRTDPDNPWAAWVAASMKRTTGQEPAMVPQLGGSICNDIFTDILGLPTIWIPHSYASCSQHAPNEHILLSEARSALTLMTGLYWDLGGGKTPRSAQSG